MHACGCHGSQTSHITPTHIVPASTIRGRGNSRTALNSDTVANVHDEEAAFRLELGHLVGSS